ncbi:MAG TPA: LuxR C-terminal-related transcriptional regulator [Phycisphaerae bacterium]|nr:LuxR C-terminal-related transcriptional regulator [Phycisphaerae bacterium]
MTPESQYPARSFPPLLDGRPWKEFCARRKLTPREAEVLQLMCRGLSNPAICQTLRVRPNTLRTHIQATFRKLKCRNRVEVVLTVAHKKDTETATT